jgi:glycosyltransferase involved in cell wall biosynthesis
MNEDIKSLSIVIPLYNAEKTIENLVDETV